MTGLPLYGILKESLSLQKELLLQRQINPVDPHPTAMDTSLHSSAVQSSHSPIPLEILFVQWREQQTVALLPLEGRYKVVISTDNCLNKCLSFTDSYAI